MSRKRHSESEIINLLRRVEVLPSQGTDMATAIREIGVSKEQAFFNEATSQLHAIAERHHDILEEDQMMEHSLKTIEDDLREYAASPSNVTKRDARGVARLLDKACNYAKDMAIEEQRIIAESPDSAAGNKEKESAQYFALANDLSAFSIRYGRNVVQAMKAA